MRNLYATCKLFSWLAELEYLCLYNHRMQYPSNIIISKNINGKVYGNSYQANIISGGAIVLMGYYGSDQPNAGYNYSKWSSDNAYFYRSTRSELSKGSYIVYHDYLFNRYKGWHIGKKYCCSRYERGKCENENCELCVQLDSIQNTLYKKDHDVADMFENWRNYPNEYILIRTKHAPLDFKFDYTRYNIA
jgi:hypothetical protein